MANPRSGTNSERTTMRLPHPFRNAASSAFLVVAPFLPALAQAPFESAQLAFYRLDGNASDSSGNNRNGEASALTFQTNRFGFAASAGRFDGVASRVGIPFPSAFNRLPVTVSTWANFGDNPASDVALVSNYYNTSANGWGLFFAGEFVRAWYYGSTGSVPTDFLNTTFLPKGSWRHLVATFDASGGRLYLDGQRVASHGWSGTANPSTSTLGLLIGETLSQQGTRRNFKGSIDDVRVYGRALSASEVKGLYDYEANPFRRASAVAQVVNGFVVGVSVEEGGQGFTTHPLVDILGNGSGAKAVATVSNGRVTGIQVTAPGTGYTGTVTVRIAAPPRAPSLAIAVQAVRVSLNVVEGLRYRIESSIDLATWLPAGEFIAEADTITRDFAVADTGSFFRVEQLP
jgi:hypothetical protein